jgi:hypothetical protein
MTTNQKALAKLVALVIACGGTAWALHPTVHHGEHSYGRNGPFVVP